MLKDADGTALDYHHFGLPLLRVPDALLARVRNLTVRYLRPGTLFPTEVPQYDTWVIREALHNAIAHQDYGLSARVNVVELPEQLVFSNAGRFLPGTVQELLATDRSPEQYRNPCLTQAMVALKMIDTIGSGIRRMYIEQRKRFFPLPDYLIDAAQQRVEVRLTGRILDERYTQVLMQQPELSLMDVFLLDKVQKRLPLGADGGEGSARAQADRGPRAEPAYLRAGRRSAGRAGAVPAGQGLREGLLPGYGCSSACAWALQARRPGTAAAGQAADVLSGSKSGTRSRTCWPRCRARVWSLRTGSADAGRLWRLLPAGLDRLAAEAGGEPRIYPIRGCEIKPSY